MKKAGAIKRLYIYIYKYVWNLSISKKGNELLFVCLEQTEEGEQANYACTHTFIHSNIENLRRQLVP